MPEGTKHVDASVTAHIIWDENLRWEITKIIIIILEDFDCCKKVHKAGL